MANASLLSSVALITIVCVCLASIDATRTVDNFFTKSDHQRLQQIFSEGIKSSDLQNIYYSVINSKNIPADGKTALCKKLAGLYADSKLNVSFPILTTSSCYLQVSSILGL